MNIWELLLTILGWLLFAALILLTALLIAGVVIYVVRAVKPSRRKQDKATALSDDAITELAELHAGISHGSMDLFGNSGHFMRGVEFALNAKKVDNADSI